MLIVILKGESNITNGRILTLTLFNFHIAFVGHLKWLSHSRAWVTRSLPISKLVALMFVTTLIV